MKKCEVCGGELPNPLATHCSDDCLRKSIVKSQKFDPVTVKKRRLGLYADRDF